MKMIWCLKYEIILTWFFHPLAIIQFLFYPFNFLFRKLLLSDNLDIEIWIISGLSPTVRAQYLRWNSKKRSFLMNWKNRPFVLPLVLLLSPACKRHKILHFLQNTHFVPLFCAKLRQNKYMIHIRKTRKVQGV